MADPPFFWGLQVELAGNKRYGLFLFSINDMAYFIPHSTVNANIICQVTTKRIMDKVTLLSPNLLTTSEGDVLYSKLLALLRESKQERANRAQWEGLIRGFTQKGVKQAELDDSDVVSFLQSRSADAKITKPELVAAVGRRMPRIKCVDLGSPQYPSYRSIDGGVYRERLYILASEGMLADDQMEDLMYRIEDLGFNPGPLLQDPGLVDRLEAEMKYLKDGRPAMFDFHAHHFSKAVENHGKNLMAHARTSVADGLFYVEEIQSDWAQRGRNSNWTAGYPKAPFVTNTEQWAGLVLRDLMHQAASDPACQRFAWLNADMRNGWNQTAPSGDDLKVFYDSIVKKLAEKCIQKSGGRVVPMEIVTKHGARTVLGFDMTPSVREALHQALPMYSRDAVLPRSAAVSESERDVECAEVVRECKAMLGSAHTIRFVAKLYDVSHSNEVAGQYLNKGITLSLRARNLNRAARHEAWHFAHENFLLSHEKREMRLAFAVGSSLNTRTQDALRAVGAHEAAQQCLNESECAAHAFSLWCEGKLEVAEAKPANIFASVLRSLEAMADWLEEKVFGIRVQTPEDLFTAMREGALAHRQTVNAYDQPVAQP